MKITNNLILSDEIGELKYQLYVLLARYGQEFNERGLINIGVGGIGWGFIWN